MMSRRAWLSLRATRAANVDACRPGGLAANARRSVGEPDAVLEEELVRRGFVVGERPLHSAIVEPVFGHPVGLDRPTRLIFFFLRIGQLPSRPLCLGVPSV